MGFGRRIQYFLVHTLKYTNKEAKALISASLITVNAVTIDTNVELKDSDEITVDGKLIKEYKPVYIKYYKPVGLVSSLNQQVEHSLFPVFKDHLPLIIAGRLDKSSEGLLVLTNNGKWARKITDPNNYKEKEYIVKVNEKIGNDFIIKMSAGVDIGFYVTKPCKCSLIDEFSFSIILTEGKNKQIRRMCKTLGRQVIFLQRIRIEHITIEKMKQGSFEMLNIENKSLN